MIGGRASGVNIARTINYNPDGEAEKWRSDGARSPARSRDQREPMTYARPLASESLYPRINWSS